MTYFSPVESWGLALMSGADNKLDPDFPFGFVQASANMIEC